MAGKSSSISTTLILCSICLLVGWFWGVRSSNKEVIESKLTSVPNASPEEETVNAPPAKAETSSEVIVSAEDAIDFSQTPAQLLEHSRTIEDPAKRQLYLRKLLEHWINEDDNFPKEARDQFLAGILPLSRLKNVGYETQFSYYVAKIPDASLRNSWKMSFSTHPARSEIFSQFIARDLIANDPVALLQNSSHWNAWERERYQTKVLEGWTGKEPSQAYAWYEANKSQFPEDTKHSIFDAWAKKDFDGLAAHIDSILDEETRNSALDSMAKEMAGRGTDGALDWANSLSSTQDQDLAHDTIYRETPRGIGAVLKPENGFPSVVEPLVANGLEPGDLIISAQNGEVVTDFYGKELMEAVEALIGTPGTDVTVQIMRQDPTTGEYQQTEITITRQQLWMEGEKEKDKKP